jgi:hypothetical protein
MEPTPKPMGKLTFAPINVLEPVNFDMLEPGADISKYGKVHAPVNVLEVCEIDCSVVSNGQPPSEEGAK